MAFQPQTTDFDLSPYTGMTRRSWIEAGRYLLEGIFRHVKRFEDPVIVKRAETKITYPHESASPARLEAERRAEIFEGLTRSFFIAAPLIHDDRSVSANGYSLCDYYKTQILRSCTQGDSNYAGSYEYLKELSGDRGAPCFQQTVETCALVIGLWACKEEIWDTYAIEEQDGIAALISGFAHAQQYVLREDGGERELANVTFWRGEREGVLYRRQF